MPEVSAVRMSSGSRDTNHATSTPPPGCAHELSASSTSTTSARSPSRFPPKPTWPARSAPTTPSLPASTPKNDSLPGPVSRIATSPCACWPRCPAHASRTSASIDPTRYRAASSRSCPAWDRRLTPSVVEQRADLLQQRRRRERFAQEWKVVGGHETAGERSGGVAGHQQHRQVRAQRAEAVDELRS